MKIIHLSTDDYTGGASIAAYRLHSFLLSKSVISTMLVLKNTTTEQLNIIKFNSTLKDKIKARIIAILNKRKKLIYSEKQGLFSIPHIGSKVENHKNVLEADIIVLHWINRNFLNIKNIETVLKLGKPVFWVLHDMWAMTGGCHHSFTCDKYITHCGNCPHLLKPSSKDASFHLFEKKINSFIPYRNLEIITPSKWLGNCAKESKLFSNHKIHVIPNLLNTNDFKPINRNEARKLFNLPEDKTLILFGAIAGLENPYKGWSYLMDCLNQISNKNISAVILGTDYNQEIANNLSLPLYFLGHLRDKQSICMLYNAVDIFVSPSLADNFPNTILESLACGIPVVGFNIGGIPDLIKHKENGYLAKYKDSADLTNGIQWVIDNKQSLLPNIRNSALNIIDEAEIEYLYLFNKK